MNFILGNYTNQVIKIKTEVMYFMSLHAGLAALLFLLILIYYPAKPKNLPSFTAGEKREDFIQGLKSFMTNKSAVMICIAFTLSQGIAEAFYPVLDLDFAPIGVSESTTGYIGFLASVVASLTSFAISTGVERMKGSFKMIIVILLSTAVCFYLWQTLLVVKVVVEKQIDFYESVLS